MRSHSCRLFCPKTVIDSRFFFFKQKTAYEIMPSLVGSEMCIRDRYTMWRHRIEMFPYKCIARRIYVYTLPGVEKMSSKNRPRGCGGLFTILLAIPTTARARGPPRCELGWEVKVTDIKERKVEGVSTAFWDLLQGKQTARKQLTTTTASAIRRTPGL